jgi:hypothetical protein
VVPVLGSAVGVLEPCPVPVLLDRRGLRLLAAFLLAVPGCVNEGESLPGPADGRSPRDAGGPADSGIRDAAGISAWIAEQSAVNVECGDGDSTRLYEERIEPLFKDDKPASCNQCHLSGLDLQVFMRDTPCQSMACLVSLGWVDEQAPDESMVLDWIARGSNAASPLITESVVQKEYEAFREWIHYSLECSECASVACPGLGDGGAFCPTEAEHGAVDASSTQDPGGCSDEALLEVFRSTVYATRGRCSPCHLTDHDFEDYKAPQWLDVLADCDSASRHTYWNVLDRGYIDFEDPSQSLLLQKPLGEDLGGVEHGGGEKFWSRTEDPGYLSFSYFAERVAECR